MTVFNLLQEKLDDILKNAFFNEVIWLHKQDIAMWTTANHANIYTHTYILQILHFYIHPVY